MEGPVRPSHAEHPDIDRVALRPGYDRIEWPSGPAGETGFEAWRTGRTGYPVVDAAMRELAATGRMHNRLRMIAPSFLVKDLLIDWRLGERWFRRLLIDGDIPQNAGHWHWVAGAGPDAAPYFRVFNPVTHGRRFDPRGLPAPVAAGTGPPRHKAIHAPWQAGPPRSGHRRGLNIGVTYPHPIVDHATALKRTIEAYRQALC